MAQVKEMIGNKAESQVNVALSDQAKAESQVNVALSDQDEAESQVKARRLSNVARVDHALT